MKIAYTIFTLIGLIVGTIFTIQGNDVYGTIGYVFAYISKIGYNQCRIINIQYDTLKLLKELANLKSK